MTILSETTKNTTDTTGIMLVLVVAILFVILLIIRLNDCNYAAVFTLLIAVIICVIVSMAISLKPHRQIKAIISDEYSAVDLYDKYDVEERDGAIWVLTEKEPMTEEDEG